MLLWLVLLVAAGTRLINLDLSSYWYDEAYTVAIVRDGLGHVLDTVPRTEMTPYLYYLLAWAWAQVLGIGETGLRLLSAVGGIATVGVVYSAARRLVSERAGIAAAAVCAVNPFLIYYSQEARAYSLLALMIALTILFLAVARDAPDRTGPLIGWAICAALALNTHYFAVFAVVPEALWLLHRSRDRRVLIAVGAVAAVGLALLPLVLEQAGDGAPGFISDTTLSSRTDEMAQHLAGGPDALANGRRPWELYLCLAGLALLAVGFASLEERARRGVLLAAGLAACAAGLPLLAALAGFDYVDSRNMIGAIPPLAIVLGAGLTSPRTVYAGVPLLLVLAAVSLVNVKHVAEDPLLRKSHWREFAEALGDRDPLRAVAVPWPAMPTIEAYRDVDEPTMKSGRKVDEIVIALSLTSPVNLPTAPFERVESAVYGEQPVAVYRSARPQRLRTRDLIGGAAAGFDSHVFLDVPDGEYWP